MMYYLLVFAFVLPVASCAFISPTCPNPNNVLVSCGICERSSTWSSSPVCFPSVDNPGDDPICALASRTFANGRGISMLATSPVLRRMQTLDIFQNYEIVEHANEEEKSPPWIVRDIPNRGKGVIATRQINRGDRIMTNTPILVIDWTNLAKFEEERNFMLQEAVNALPRRSQKLFWNLQAHLGQGPIEARIRTNSHGVLLDDILHYGIFPEQARFNHDCRPNAAYSFDEAGFTQYTHAATTIYPGNEITVAYIDVLKPFALRQETLKNTWRFTCTCSLCTHPANSIVESDVHIAQIKRLAEEIQANPVIASTDSVEALLMLTEKERLWAHSTRAHHMAALSYSGYGDKVKAMEHAKLAIEEDMIKGSRNDWEEHAVRELIEKSPENCDSWKRKHRLDDVRKRVARQNRSKI